MSGAYPDYKTYRALYARYHSGRDIKELLALLEPLHGAHLLDLCAGEGQLILEALTAGAGSVTIIDQESSMVPFKLCGLPKVRVMIGSASDQLFVLESTCSLFDRITCRQGVNYWLDESTALRIASIITPGGIFAFNTFNQKPSEKPRVLEYELEGHSFVETSWLIGDTVQHVQVRDGMEPHTTSFRWISPEEFRTLLKPYFVIGEDVRGKTSLYRCVKK